MTTKSYPDGSVYIGQLKDGKRDGRGTLTCTNGNKYEGQYQNDMKHGQGTETFPCGETLVAKYNRMVLFDGMIPHAMDISNDRYFGEEYRKNQVFFFD